MPIRKAAHVTYNIQYHFVWIPKYRKMVLDDEIAQELEKLIYGIAERYEFTIEELAIARDHVHLFLSAPPRYAPSKIMDKIKGITAIKLFQRFPSIKEMLWGGHLWSRGYYVGTWGDKVTNNLIRRYIQYQRKQDDQLEQERLF
jgi:putative transposase